MKGSDTKRAFVLQPLLQLLSGPRNLLSSLQHKDAVKGSAACQAWSTCSPGEADPVKALLWLH